jgi:hypothetical protein
MYGNALARQQHAATGAMTSNRTRTKVRRAGDTRPPRQASAKSLPATATQLGKALRRVEKALAALAPRGTSRPKSRRTR